jgi:precorrin-6B methylase 2
LKALLKKSVSSLSEAWTKCNEYMLGIRTEPESVVDCKRNTAQERGGTEVSGNARYGDNSYATIGYLNIGKVLRIVKPGPQDVFCDLGCGMGRILCVAARQPVRKCIGVELLEPLCEIARRNAARLRGRKAPIEIVRGDATTVDLSEGTIYFMFNPFGADTLRDTLENMRGSLSQKPRTITIAYYNSQYVSVLEELGWLAKVHEFETFGGHRVTFWENRESAGRMISADGERIHKAAFGPKVVCAAGQLHHRL